MSALPGTWSEIHSRLARVLGGGPDAEAAGLEWIRQALEEAWGAQDVLDLPRVRRSVALQRASGVLLALEELSGDLAFDPNVREVVSAVFERYFHVNTPGPPWRLSPAEELPTRAEYLADVGF